MICTFYGVGASASAPQQKSQAPGYYRIMLGKFEITALSDGTSPLPVDQLLTNTTPAQIDAGLQKAFLQEPVVTSTNAFLINTGAKLVLVDAGFGIFFGPAQGKLLSNLKAAGYRPEEVDEIYITHMHGDHVGGLVVADKQHSRMLSFAPISVRRVFGLAKSAWIKPPNRRRVSL